MICRKCVLSAVFIRMYICISCRLLCLYFISTQVLLQMSASAQYAQIPLEIRAFVEVKYAISSNFILLLLDESPAIQRHWMHLKTSSLECKRSATCLWHQVNFPYHLIKGRDPVTTKWGETRNHQILLVVEEIRLHVCCIYWPLLASLRGIGRPLTSIREWNDWFWLSV